ncbi:TPA: molecular chaperone [Serratia fonticola]|uniref:fimbrial biogenesis chaperone n=1 Tax=Serratia fonticola TaxID=47917 RepID=UPI0013786272|nr:fimbria/pilus periplasmic chaperone [Serratia fonticola]NBJ36968.1 fimbria/pilus periplasmic chaperone [Serratia fonticola]
MRFPYIFMLYVFLAVNTVQASTTIGSTRVIYPGNEREITVPLRNPEKGATLVQAWIDQGNINATPDDTAAPFLVMPPLVRINAGEGATLKIMFTQQNLLPQDRESVFWLNVLDIPPVLEGNETNYMQLAYRTRVKLFYRPQGVTGDSTQAIKKMVWTVLLNDKGKEVIKGCNKSDFYLSFNRLAVVVNLAHYTNDDGGMIAPATCMSFPVTFLKKMTDSMAYVSAQWIDDYGSIQQYRGELTR